MNTEPNKEPSPSLDVTFTPEEQAIIRLFTLSVTHTVRDYNRLTGAGASRKLFRVAVEAYVPPELFDFVVDTLIAGEIMRQDSTGHLFIVYGQTTPDAQPRADAP